MPTNFLGMMGFQGPPDTRMLQNQPTSSDSLSEEAEAADEPPEPKRLLSVKQQAHPTKKDTQFKKTTLAITKQSRQSLLTQILHTSDSNSEGDESEPLTRATTQRTQSSASTYSSRGSAVSMAELTSDGGHVTPPMETPSPPLPPAKFGLGRAPVFNHKMFETPQPPNITVVENMAVDPLQKVGETKVEAGLGRKRCITFACASKKEVKPDVQAVEAKAPETRRPSALKFMCPMKETKSEAPVKPKTRHISPPPKPKEPSLKLLQPEAKRGSDATIQNAKSSPKVLRKSSDLLRAAPRKDAVDSDSDVPDDSKFHEFAASDGEPDEWTNMQSCFPHRLTIDDTLAIEQRLRRLGREAEEEVEDEEEEDDEDIEEDENNAYLFSDEDDGFQSDDEHGFAHSDDEDDDPDFEFWTHGNISAAEGTEFIKPHGQRLQRSDSASSTESTRPLHDASHKQKRKSTQPVDMQQRPELPDSTDFVCGTLDEDKPLEQAYLIHLEKRRQAKHKPVPQDFDPTFPTSDPEIDEEDEDEEGAADSDAIDGAAQDSDHPSMFLHGQMDVDSVDDTYPARVIPKKRSPLGSPKRVLRSPPPAKKMLIRRSPPPHGHHLTLHATNANALHHHAVPAPGHGQVKVRGRSPAPTTYHMPRLSTSLPRRHGQSSAVLFKDFASAHTSTNVSATASDNEDPDENDDQCMTPRLVNRGAIDIVMGLETKRQRRREKLYEKHCKLKAQREARERERDNLLRARRDVKGMQAGAALWAPKDVHVQAQQLRKGYGKGAEKMRELITGERKDRNKVKEKEKYPMLAPGERNARGLPVAISVQGHEEEQGKEDVHMMSY